MTIIFQARPPKCRCCSPSRTLWTSPWRRTPRPSSSVKTLASEVSLGQSSSQVFVPFGFIRCQHNVRGQHFSRMKDWLICFRKTLFLVLLNAAGQCPGPVATSSADGPLQFELLHKTSRLIPSLILYPREDD